MREHRLGDAAPWSCRAARSARFPVKEEIAGSSPVRTAPQGPELHRLRNKGRQSAYSQERASCPRAARLPSGVMPERHGSARALSSVRKSASPTRKRPQVQILHRPRGLRSSARCSLHVKLGSGVFGPLKTVQARIAQWTEHQPTELGLRGFESLCAYGLSGIEVMNSSPVTVMGDRYPGAAARPIHRAAGSPRD